MSTKNSSNGVQVLVVEDEEDIAELIQFHLQQEGYFVDWASNGLEVLPKLDKNLPDLVILDIMLPGLNGIELCKRIKEKYLVPIIMVTARTGETDAVLGLELGADDYVRKPFSVRELMARIKTILKRYAVDVEIEQSGNITVGKIELNPSAYKVYINGQLIELTLIEYKILHLFLSNPSIAFSRDKLLDKIWGHDTYITDRAVDVHIKRLRDKLLTERERLETVRGVGYRFNNE